MTGFALAERFPVWRDADEPDWQIRKQMESWLGARRWAPRRQRAGRRAEERDLPLARA